jgi:hypothetical protein
MPNEIGRSVGNVARLIFEMDQFHERYGRTWPIKEPETAYRVAAAEHVFRGLNPLSKYDLGLIREVSYEYSGEPTFADLLRRTKDGSEIVERWASLLVGEDARQTGGVPSLELMRMAAGELEDILSEQLRID